MARTIVDIPIVAADVDIINADKTACAGMQYRTTDTDEIYVGAADGSLIGPTQKEPPPKFYGDHPDDETAGLNGVPLGAIYFLTFTNSYGLPEGTPKKRTTQ